MIEEFEVTLCAQNSVKNEACATDELALDAAAHLRILDFLLRTFEARQSFVLPNVDCERIHKVRQRTRTRSSPPMRLTKRVDFADSNFPAARQFCIKVARVVNPFVVVRN